MSATVGAREAAERIGVSYDWLLDQCRAGRAQYRKVGRRYRFTDEDITATLDAHRVEVTGSEPEVGGLTGRSASRLRRAS